MKNIITPIACAIALSAAVSSCQKPEPLPFEGRSLAVILSDNNIEQLKIAKGIMGAALEAGLYVDFVYGNGVDNYQSQIQLLSTLDTSKYIGLIIYPASNPALDTALAPLAAKFPVVIIDGVVSHSVNYTSFVGTDNLAAGENTAKIVAKTVAASSTVAIFELNNNNASASRTAGLNATLSALNTDHTTIQVSATDSIAPIISTLITTHPDLSAIVATDYLTALKTARAIVALNLPDLDIFTFGTNPQVIVAIPNGPITGTMANNTYKIGFKAVQAVAEKFLGTTPAKTQYQPTLYIDQNNILSYQAQQFINSLYD